ncbi:MAG: FAD-dependent oxidoreductase, partial [Chloroflexi bacterium]|nr:FAD-dependent oxidoreductase [Chloroflexota bacterium]
GLVAATICAQAGASVILLERDPWAGGKLGIQSQPLQGPATMFSGESGFEYRDRLIEEASTAGVQVRLGAEVQALSSSVEGSHLHAEEAEPTFTLSVDGLPDGNGKLSVPVVVLAAGSREPDPDFPGSDLHGVMKSGDAQVALNIRGQLVGNRIVMAGSDNAGLLIARNLLDAGADVLAVLEDGPRIVGRKVNAAPLREAGVEILTSTKLVSANGDGKLERVHVETVVGTEPSQFREFEADTLCLAWPRAPESALAVEGGSPTLCFDVLGGDVPVQDRFMETSIPGLFVCGDNSGVESGAVALETGKLAGLSALRHLGLYHSDTQRIARQAAGRLSYLRRGNRGAKKREAKQSLHAEFYRLF